MTISISLDDFVNREIIHSANTLISDLKLMLPHLPMQELRDVSVGEDELMNLSEITDWQEPVERHVAEMDRDGLILALEYMDVDDERDEADISAAAAHELRLEGGDVDDEDIADRLDQWPGVSDDDLRRKLLTHLEDEDGWEEFADDHRIEADRSEVYEFWVVTDWLAARLKEKGHPVEEICGFVIWGRPTTGQHISMDSVIREIYREWAE